MKIEPIKYTFSLTVIWLILSCFHLNAQQSHLSLQFDQLRRYDQYLHFNKETFHTSLRPYRQSEIQAIVFTDTVPSHRRFVPETGFKRFLNVVLHEDLLSFDEGGLVRYAEANQDFLEQNVDMVRRDTSWTDRKFYIAVNPILKFELGYDFFDDKVIGVNTRGLSLSANIGKKVSLYTAFTETQGKFSLYLSSQISRTRVAPGEGKVKPFKNTGFDYSGVTGYLSYSPHQAINLEIGHGKHFVGDGYRSLLLSDNSFVYPYVKATANFWRFKYTYILSEMINDVDAKRDFTLGFPRKYATFLYLSADIAKWLELGVFEGIMWRRTTTEGNTTFDPNILNPIIGVRALQKDLDNNAVYGLNFKFSTPISMIFYGQLMIDKFSKKGIKNFNSRTGIQVGTKYLNAFGADNLNLQLEANMVRPYSYTSDDTVLHYSHFGQALAHPQEANFAEIVGLIDYRYKRLYGAWKMSYVKTATEIPQVNNGSSIFKDNTTASFSDNTKNRPGWAISQ